MKKETDDEDLAFEQMPHLAEGDILPPAQDDFSVGQDSFSVGTGDSGTANASQVPQMATPANPVGTGPQPAAITHPTALTTKALNPSPLAGMPADVDPNELARYLEQQKNSYSKYGADAQFNLGNTMNKNRVGLGNSLANAGAGFADAIMQGVAGAGEGHFQKNLQDRENQVASDAIGTMKNAHDTALSDVKANIEMDSKNAQSPISRSSQKSYASTLIAAGIPADQVKNMSADLISDVAGKRITLADALARLQLENQYHMGELNLQTLQTKANIENQRAQRRTESAKALSGRSTLQALGQSIPFTAGNAAKQTLENEMKGGATEQAPAPIASRAEYDALPSGTRYVDSQGTVGRKK